MVLGVLALFPDIHQNKLVAAIKPGFNVVNAHLSHSPLGIFDDVQKTSRMLVRHKTPSGQVFAKEYFSENWTNWKDCRGLRAKQWRLTTLRSRRLPRKPVPLHEDRLWENPGISPSQLSVSCDHLPRDR